MAASECSYCHKIVFYDERMGDYVHDCNDFPPAAVLGVEDVVVLGKWSDYTGSSTDPQLDKNLQSLAAQNYGTKGFLLGNKAHAYTNRGSDAATHRQRGHVEYFEPK